MFRTLLSLLLGLAFVAEASAQTTPTTTSTTATTTATKTTKATRTTRRPVKKARRTTTRKTTVKTVGAAKTPTPLRNQPAAVPAGRDDIGPGGNGAVGSTAIADGKGQGVYAAPGMPVNVSDPQKAGAANDNKTSTPVNRTSTSSPAPR